MAIYKLFEEATPTSTDLSDGPYTLATRIDVTADGTITHIGWRFPDTIPGGTVEYYIVYYNDATDDNDGLIELGTFSSPVAGIWNWQALITPAPITAPKKLLIELFTPDRYVATPAYFASAKTLGPLTGPADDAITPRRNGRYNLGSPAGFARSGSGAAYSVDIQFQTAGSTIDLAGNLAVTANRSGPANITKTFDGSLVLTASRTAVLALAKNFDGNAAISAALTGNLALAKNFDGSLTVMVNPQGVLSKVLTLSGTLTVAAALVGAITTDADTTPVKIDVVFRDTIQTVVVRTDATIIYRS